MATSKEYGLGPQTFPRGWFIVAPSVELDKGPMAVRYFGKDFALYRGESGRPVMLDAYCGHMGTHITASKGTFLASEGKQIEGDSIRCPYHGWRYNAQGQVDDIPYQDGPCPRSADINSYEVRDVMGCVMMWHDPEGGEPDFEPPFLKEWDDPQWMNWRVDDLGQIGIHTIEILDNMADSRHLGPTHGAPCEYFSNEFKDHIVVQRQGGHLQLYGTHLHTVTWYTGMGILISSQIFGEAHIMELIANIPVEDGVSQAWHGVMVKAANNPPSEEDRQGFEQAEAGALQAFSADFDVWKNKRSAIKILQLKNDGPFNMVRRWCGQFYASRTEAQKIQQEINGVVTHSGMPAPDPKWAEVEKDMALGLAA